MIVDNLKEYSGIKFNPDDYLIGREIDEIIESYISRKLRIGNYTLKIVSNGAIEMKHVVLSDYSVHVSKYFLVGEKILNINFGEDSMAVRSEKYTMVILNDKKSINVYISEIKNYAQTHNKYLYNRLVESGLEFNDKLIHHMGYYYFIVQINTPIRILLLQDNFYAVSIDPRQKLYYICDQIDELINYLISFDGNNK